MRGLISYHMATKRARFSIGTRGQPSSSAGTPADCSDYLPGRALVERSHRDSCHAAGNRCRRRGKRASLSAVLARSLLLRREAPPARAPGLATLRDHDHASSVVGPETYPTRTTCPRFLHLSRQLTPDTRAQGYRNAANRTTCYLESQRRNTHVGAASASSIASRAFL